MPAVRHTVPPPYKELRLIWLLGWIAIVSAYFFLSQAWHRGAANQWILQTGLLWWLVYYQTTQRLHLNRVDRKATPYPNLGWGNRLTIIRGGMIAVTGGFLFQAWPSHPVSWAPGIIYTFAAIIDRVDGYVARKTRHTSLLGQELDTVFDALGLAIAPLLAVWYGQIHWSYLAVSISYYLFQSGIRWRRKQALSVRALPQNFIRRSLAGFQMGFIAVVLLPVFSPPITTIAGVAFMLPILTGFAVDWLIASSRINPQAPDTALFFNKLESFSQSVFQPALRIIIALTLLVIVQQAGVSLQNNDGGTWYSIIYTYGCLLAGSMILLGCVGRISALALILLLGLHYLSSPPDLPGYILIFSIIWLMLLGSGRFSLWRWDDRWINRYDGT